MHPLNVLSTITSLSVLLVTIERFSFTTNILLPPYEFLRLHEVVQMIVLILLTVLVPFFMLYEVTNKFETMQKKSGLFLGAVFISGIYFYATGNGIHELGSFLFNTYCDTKIIVGNFCGGVFFNDFYFGNGLYFIGAFLMNIVLLVFEQRSANTTFEKKHHRLLIINSLIYALAIFAYAAFDRVWVGFVYSCVMTIVINGFLFRKRSIVWNFPVTLSLAIAYNVGTLASLPFRFH